MLAFKKSTRITKLTNFKFKLQSDQAFKSYDLAIQFFSLRRLIVVGGIIFSRHDQVPGDSYRV